MSDMRNAMFLLLALGAVVCVPTVHASEAAKTEFSRAVRSNPDPHHGAMLFRDCAVCHGANGNGSDDGGVPRIAGQHFRVIIRQIVDYRHETRWDIRMEHFAGRGLLPDAQSIADVAAYATRLRGDVARDVGDGTQVARGAKVYAQRCADCHGKSGEGDNQSTVPHLAGQHYDYLLRQMYDALDGRRPNFSGAHLRLLAKLERDDLTGIADFLARLEWASASALASGTVSDPP